MPKIAEHIAIEALRDIAKLEHTNPAVRIARNALDKIDEINKPVVHNLSAADVIIDTPPGGGC